MTREHEKKESSSNIQRYSFDDFIVSEGSRLAFAVALACAQAPGCAYNPLYLYSDSGLGKTHLMNAIVLYVEEKEPKKRILHISAADFCNELITSIQEGKRGDLNARSNFKKKFQDIDLLLVDDIEFLIGKPATQQEFLHRFDQLINSNLNTQVVISSDIPPKELVPFDKALQSRFGMGIVVNIAPPDYATRLAILEHICSRDYKYANIQKEDLCYIAKNLTRNIRTLEGGLRRVIATYSLEMQNEKLRSPIQEILQDMVEEECHPLTENGVILEVAKYFNISVSDVKSRNRSKNVVMARGITVYLLFELLGLTLKAIGRLIERDRSTVAYSISKIQRLMQSDYKTKYLVEFLEKKLEVEKDVN